MRVRTAARRRAAGRRLPKWLLVGADLFAAGLLAWYGLHLAFGDRWSWLYAINALAPYLFLPLPVALIIGVWARRWPALIMSLVGILVWAGLYGRYFVPRSAPVEAGSVPLRVMATNVLGWNRQGEAVAAALLASDADVIAIQELNRIQAEWIRLELTDEYPYQVLYPVNGVTGAGVISRYPFEPTGEVLTGGWRSVPHILRLDVNGQSITFIRFHTLSGLSRVETRQAAAQSLADYARTHPGPLIAAGDLNATPLNDAHQVIVGVLNDAWDAQGRGLGHTFPGALSPGSSRPVYAGIAVPKWLVRLDYIFYSDDFQAVSAEFGPWDGYSDHRPIVAELVLR